MGCGGAAPEGTRSRGDLVTGRRARSTQLEPARLVVARRAGSWVDRLGSRSAMGCGGAAPEGTRSRVQATAGWSGRRLGSVAQQPNGAGGRRLSDTAGWGMMAHRAGSLGPDRCLQGKCGRGLAARPHARRASPACSSPRRWWAPSGGCRFSPSVWQATAPATTPPRRSTTARRPTAVTRTAGRPMRVAPLLRRGGSCPARGDRVRRRPPVPGPLAIAHRAPAPRWVLSARERFE